MNTPDVSVGPWRRSSRSGTTGGQCVEVQWRKSSRSGSSGGQCVEVADLDTVIAVRDSKNPDGPKLTFDAHTWRTFTHRVKRNDHDLT
jgi:uncharacterized protein DUF397